MRSALVVGVLLLVWCGAESAGEWENGPDEGCGGYHRFKDGIGNITIFPSYFRCKMLIPVSVGEGIRIRVNTLNLGCGVMQLYLKRTVDDTFQLNNSWSSIETPFEILTNSSVGLYMYNSHCSSQLSLVYSRGSAVNWTMHAKNDPSVQDKTDRLCINGGTLSTFGLPDKLCTCPPGFAGAICKQACGPNLYGAQCENRCSDGPQGCRGKTFEIYQHPQFSCAAGFSGPSCDELCDSGQYGANCTQQCGQCSGEEGCDPYTGDCPGGCKLGFYGTQCKQKFTHLLYGPNITDVSATSFSGSVLLTKENVAGEGHVDFYELQYKDAVKEVTPASNVQGGSGGRQPPRDEHCGDDLHEWLMNLEGTKDEYLKPHPEGSLTNTQDAVKEVTVASGLIGEI